MLSPTDVSQVRPSICSSGAWVACPFAGLQVSSSSFPGSRSLHSALYRVEQRFTAVWLKQI